MENLREITARFASVCPQCRKQIAIGDRVLWTPGSKASHKVCPSMSAQDRNDREVFLAEGKSRGITADPDYDMYLSEQEMDRDDASYMAWLNHQAGGVVHPVDCGCSTCIRNTPQRISVEDQGVYVMPDGAIVRVQANADKSRTYALRLTEFGGTRLTEKGEVVNAKYVYEIGLVQQVAAQGRKMNLEEAKAFILRYGFCARCSLKLKAAKSVERGIGPICLKYFSGTTAATLVAA